MWTRRDLLRDTCAALGVAALPPPWLARAAGAPRDERAAARRLVVLELRGGLDGLAALQPTDDDRLRRARPTLARPASELHRIAEGVAFHARLGRLARRFREGGLGVWRDVGHDGPNLSHFESRDLWDEGSTASVRSGVGWLGAFGRGESDDPLALLALGDGVPGALRVSGEGTSRQAAAVRDLRGLTFRGPGRPGGEAERARRDALLRLLALPQGDAERAFVARASLDTADAARRLAAAERFRPRSDWPGTPLARDLAQVAAVIDAGLPTRVLHVVHDGYDTHAEQRRTLDRLLGELDAALDAFLAHLERGGRLGEVLVMTTSEFGRRVAESGDGGSVGTDHGAANPMFFAGGRARRGLFGAAPDLGDLDAIGNLRARVDFRGVYAGVLRDWLGCDPARVLDADVEPVEVIET